MAENIEGFPLSPQQKRLWQLQQQDGQTYAAQCVIRIEGKLNSEALKQAARRIVERHEILRTEFHCPPGMTLPVQVIRDDDGGLSFDRIDLSGVSQGEQEARMTELLRQQRLTPFRFSEGSLLRLALVTLSPESYILNVTLPSLCADAQTLKNFAEELSSEYAARSQGEVSDQSSLQYADYAEWQYELLEGEDAAEGKAYWEQQFYPDALKLSLADEDRAPEASQLEPQSLRVSMMTEQATKIEALARSCDTSAEVLLLACWQVLLWHLTGQREVVVGYMADGRKYSELRGAMGLFSRFLPLGSRFEPDFKFNEVLTHAERLRREADEWQDYFLRGQDAGTISAATGFPVIAFEFEEMPAAHASGGVSFAAERQLVRTERFEIKLTITRAVDSLSAEFHYDANVYRRARIERLAKQFERVVESVVSKPASRLDELEVIGDDERQQLLVTWNETRRDYPERQCAHELFEAQAYRQADAIAVLFDEQQVSYRELNERANKLAHYLRKRGVRPGTFVGVCLQRSVDMVIAMLGVLKAGGAYLPLDSEYPRSRLAYMLEDTRAGFLLSHEGLLESLPEYHGEVIRLDRDSRLIEEEPANNPLALSSPERIACIFYTSGSTGRPKGVMASHRGVVNYLSFLGHAYGINRDSIVLQLASLSFDASVRDTLGPLVLGGRTVILNPAEAREPSAMLARIRKHSINTIASIVPTLLRSLMEAAPAELLPYSSVRTVLASGENLYLSDYRKAQEVFGPEVRLVNQYGPTECAMTSSYEPVGAEQGHRTTALIGKPISNACFYILNEALRPVPVGVPGEIHIGGHGLAYGYLNRPDLTAARFLPNPFSSEPGARMYRTGDLGRYLSSGKMELCGRLDWQVKLRGYRIELGEIEAVLTAHPAVREAVVTVREDVAQGGERLVAHVVSRQPAQPSVRELRAHLGETLPEYMIPSAFVMLNALPLTPNGKVDRKALPAPEHANLELESAFVAPRTPAEDEVAAVWARVLGHERIGIHDNFFELGGHSLLAIQLVSQLSEIFQIELPLISLFEAPTVAELALRITQMQLDEVGDEELMQMIGEHTGGPAADINGQQA